MVIGHTRCFAPNYGMGLTPVLIQFLCELSLMWFFTSCKGFPLGFFGFHPLQKPAFPNFNSIRD